VEGAYLLPVNLFTMGISKSDDPLCTPLHGTTLQQENRVFRGVKGLEEFLQVSIFNARLLLRLQPDENPCKNAASQSEDLLDGIPVRLQQTNHSHKRVVAWLHRSRRNPGMFYIVEETKIHQWSIRISNSSKVEEKGIYLQQEPTSY
jgi:hypothetical protein